MSDKTLIIGFIRSTHGLNGKVKVESTSGEVEHFFDLTEVTLQKDELNATYKVESVEGNVSSLLVKFNGIDTVEAATKLRGAQIVVPRNKACPLYKDEYYIEDLKQCTLVYKGESQKSSGKDGLNTNNDSAKIAGIVTDVLEGGSGDLLEIAVSKDLIGDFQTTALVPFKKEFIGKVDIKKKTIELLHLWILE